jgi:hypothetical protein
MGESGTVMTYVRHDNGVHEMVLHESSRVAVDAWLNQVEQIWQEHTRSRQPVMIIVDNGVLPQQPLQYAFQRGMQLSRRFSKLPPGRTAFLLNSMGVLSLLDSFLRLMRLNIQYRYFRLGQREEALHWVQELRTELEQKTRR